MVFYMRRHLPVRARKFPLPARATIHRATKIACISTCIVARLQPATTAGPVLVHGGSNRYGTGSDYDPSEMVEKTGIIVVTINYRPGVFGFLALPGLDSAQTRPSGNYGLLDQQAAMRWVRRNIASFGGDPFSITIAGESAGVIDVCAQLVSPAAAGLFRRAVTQSFYCPATTRDIVVDRSIKLAEAVGCADSSSAAACMRAKAVPDLLHAAQASAPVGPYIDGGVIPMAPDQAIASGQWNWSPVLIGSDHDEGGLAVLGRLVAAHVALPLSAGDFTRIVGNLHPSNAPAVLAEYPVSSYATPFSALSAVASDPTPPICGLSPQAQLFSAATRTFRYEFNDPDTPVPSDLAVPDDVHVGAYHSGELQYLFRVKNEQGEKTASQQQLSERMMRYWSNFARTGNPGGAGSHEWPTYRAQAPKILSLQPTGDVVIDNFDTAHHCGFWASQK
jgi:para-nitrobenzyl esterase